MKERILKELVRLKHDVDASWHMDKQIMDFLEITEDQLKVRAASVLSSILHDYDAYAVSTIDSFFQRIIRSFAREVDLQAKFDLELDQDGVLERLVERLILVVTEDEFLHRWLVSYAIEQIQEGKSWDIRRNIKSLGRQLFQEAFKRYQFQIRAFLKENDKLDALKRHVMAKRKELVNEALEIKHEANRIREAWGLNWSDFKNGSRSHVNKFDALGNPLDPIPELSPSQIGLVDNPEGWYTKSSKEKGAIIAAFEGGLGALWGKILPLAMEWNTNEAIRKNLDVFGVFQYLIDELDELKDEEGIMLISDANDFLKEITAENDAPFIYEKVGYKYQHYLIDEFQDTSGFQWESFKPLLVNSLSQGFASLLVGDVKQSIYRWRGGEMRLLLEQVELEIGHFGIDVRKLDTNFRSLPHIVYFNNALFSRLPGQLGAVLENFYGVEDGSMLSHAYADVAQQVADSRQNEAFKGKVRIEFLQKDDEEELQVRELALRKIPEMVIALQESGYRPKDIAFLVRTKKEGIDIADALISYGLQHPGSPFSFDVLSDEALLVNRSAMVQCLLSGLTYLFDAETEAYLTTMWYHWAVIFGFEVNHDLFRKGSFPLFIEEKNKMFIQSQREFLQLPLMELVDRLIDFLGLHQLGKERAYLSAFRESVYDFVVSNRADLPGFLDWWKIQQEKRTIQIPENHDAMRILTIHKSKGLQFKAVLMPFLDWNIFDVSKENIVWAPFTLDFLDMETVVPLTVTGKLSNSLFKDIYQEEALLAYLDTLNMAYVAMTRAEEVFWALAPHTSISERSRFSKLASNLLQVLQTNHESPDGICLKDYYDENSFVFDYGDWPENRLKPLHRESAFSLRWDYRKWGELLSIKPMAVEFDAENLVRRKKGNFGTMIHQLLERSKTRQQVFLGVEGLHFDGFIDSSEKNTLRFQLETLFESGKFRSWFGDDAEILTEQAVLLPDGIIKRPDRVLIFQDRVEVVDFKTGMPMKSFQDQVKTYMELVGSLLGLPVKGYLCYFERMIIEEVI